MHARSVVSSDLIRAQLQSLSLPQSSFLLCGRGRDSWMRVSIRNFVSKVKVWFALVSIGKSATPLSIFTGKFSVRKKSWVMSALSSALTGNLRAPGTLLSRVTIARSQKPEALCEKHSHFKMQWRFAAAGIEMLLVIWIISINWTGTLFVSHIQTDP